MAKKKRKVKLKNIFYFLIFIGIIVLLVMYIYDLKISTIIVKGNTLYTDWEIIKKAKLDDYPSSIQTISAIVESNLEKDPYIKKATVRKKSLTKLEIKIKENRPLFYYVPNKKTVLSNGKEVSDNYSVPTLINYVPSKIYSKFIKKIEGIDYNIVKRISEIKYDSNEVDEERFLLTMNDGNYVYLTLSKFDKINHYLEIIKEFNNKKGVLYLDSGEYFKVFE